MTAARLDERVALVTGGMSGIGAAVAARLRAEGATVLVADLAPGAPLAVDVADAASVAAMLNAVRAAHGRLDALVHCAGIGRDIPFLDTTAEAFDRIMAVNLRGTFLVGQAAARLMAAPARGAPGGSIVTIASVAGMRGNVGRAAYGASKAGVINLSQVMAIELAAHGIRVNVIAPGPVETPLVAQMHDAAIRAAWTGATPLARYGTPEEIAAAAAFLCGDDASFVTGHVLAVDGGISGAGLVRRPG